jgi:Protein of unknown function, DUF255
VPGASGHAVAVGLYSGCLGACTGGSLYRGAAARFSETGSWVGFDPIHWQGSAGIPGHLSEQKAPDAAGLGDGRVAVCGRAPSSFFQDAGWVIGLVANGQVAFNLAPPTATSTLTSFEIDRAAIERENGIGPSRPRARPVDWYDTLEFSDARRHANTTGKPLLVESSRDGCEWCKRLPWATYVDAAVVARLKPFTCVRIDSELDPDCTADSFGLDGVPVLVLFDAQG